MATVIGQRSMLPTKLEPVLSQGRIEKCFPAEQACTERDRYARADAARPPADDGFALARGVAVGALAERELVRFTISQVGCSRIVSSPPTVETLRTSMTTSAFKKSRSE